MTGQVPWVPLLNDRRTDFLSRHVGNYQHHPQWGMLVDQLWLNSSSSCLENPRSGSDASVASSWNSFTDSWTATSSTVTFLAS